MSMSTVLREQHDGVVSPLQGESPACLGGVPGGGGVGPCHSSASEGAQRLSPHNLPVAADHFRRQMGFVSLGRALPPSLAGAGKNSGFKWPHSLGEGGSYLLKPSGCAALSYTCFWASSQRIP